MSAPNQLKTNQEETKYTQGTGGGGVRRSRRHRGYELCYNIESPIISHHSQTFYSIVCHSSKGRGWRCEEGVEEGLDVTIFIILLFVCDREM